MTYRARPVWPRLARASEMQRYLHRMWQVMVSLGIIHPLWMHQQTWLYCNGLQRARMGSWPEIQSHLVDLVLIIPNLQENSRGIRSFHAVNTSSLKNSVVLYGANVWFTPKVLISVETQIMSMMYLIPKRKRLTMWRHPSEITSHLICTITWWPYGVVTSYQQKQYCYQQDCICDPSNGGKRDAECSFPCSLDIVIVLRPGI